MTEPKFPKLDWARGPELELLPSREMRPIRLRLPLTEKPAKDWSKHFKEALGNSPLAMDVGCDLEGDILVVSCSPPLDVDVPYHMEGVLQNAGIAWCNERSTEEDWVGWRKSEFNALKAAWEKRKRNQVG